MNPSPKLRHFALDLHGWLALGIFPISKMASAASGKRQPAPSIKTLNDRYALARQHLADSLKEGVPIEFSKIKIQHRKVSGLYKKYLEAAGPLRDRLDVT